jgi:uncharacterized protein (TIGR00251 family)
VTALRRDADDWILSCRVQPRSRANAFAEVRGEELVIRLTAPPVDGKANDVLRRFVADAFGVAPGRVSVESGERGRHKRVRISGAAGIPKALERLGLKGG